MRRVRLVLALLAVVILMGTTAADAVRHHHKAHWSKCNVSGKMHYGPKGPPPPIP